MGRRQIQSLRPHENMIVELVLSGMSRVAAYRRAVQGAEQLSDEQVRVKCAYLCGTDRMRKAFAKRGVKEDRREAINDRIEELEKAAERLEQAAQPDSLDDLSETEQAEVGVRECLRILNDPGTEPTRKVRVLTALKTFMEERSRTSVVERGLLWAARSMRAPCSTCGLPARFVSECCHSRLSSIGEIASPDEMS